MKDIKIKIIFALLFFICMITVANAQKGGTIKGKVKTSDGNPAKYINVVLLNTTKETITDNDGLFTINNIKKGKYKLQFHLHGIETKTVDVVLTDKITKIPDVILKEKSVSLDEIIIVAQRLNQFADKKTKYVTRLPLKNINTPQSYSVVNQKLTKEQISVDFGSSLKSVTGGNYIEANSGSVSFYARGFRADSRVRNGMKFHSRARTPIENQNIERVEVLKGSSAINYGSGFYGGLMNIVTKKPMATDKFEFGYNLGSFSLHKITTDLNKAIGKNNEYMLRLNGAFYTEDGFQSKGSEIREHYFIAPAFTYQPNDEFTLTINSEFLKGKRNLNFARFIKGAKGKTWSDLQWDYDNSYTNKELAGVFDRSVIQIFADYHFTGNWTSQTSFSHSDFSFSSPYLMTYFLPNSKMARNIMFFDPEKGGSMNIRQDFMANYDFGNIKNKTLIGASFYKSNWEFIREMRKPSAPKKPAFVDIIDLTNPNAKINNLSVDLLQSKPTTSVSQVFKDQNWAGYLSNAITFYDKVTFLSGIRYDKFKNDPTITNKKEGKDGYEQDKLSYNFGLTINPFNDKVAIFGNYMNGFNNQGPGLNKAGKYQNFDPVESKQWETGLKFNLLNGKLKSTFSYYNINIDNFILSYGKGAMSYKTQDGKVLSKGIEFDLIVNPLKGLNVVLGYTYNNAKNVKFTNPAFEGKQLPLAPEQTANAWASYKFVKGNLKGFGLGLGANYVSKIYKAFDYANTFWAKPYTTLDGTIFYQQTKYRIGVKFNNISNQKYYNAYGIAQKPFNFIFSLNYTIQ